MTDTLSDKDKDIIVKALLCQRGPLELQIDYDKLHRLTGWKNKHTAQVMWSGVKKRLEAHRAAEYAAKGIADGPAAPAASTKAAKTTKRKAKVEDDDDDVLDLRGIKKAAKTKAGSGIKDGEAEDEQSGGGEDSL